MQNFGILPLGQGRELWTKIIPWKTDQTKHMVISNRIPVVPRYRKLSELHFKPFRLEQTSNPSNLEQLGITFPWNKNRSKLQYFRSEPCPSREKNSDFLFRGTKIEANSRNAVLNHFTEENSIQNKIRQPNSNKSFLPVKLKL